MKQHVFFKLFFAFSSRRAYRPLCAFARTSTDHPPPPPVGCPAVIMWFGIYPLTKAIVLFSFEGLLHILIDRSRIQYNIWYIKNDPHIGNKQIYSLLQSTCRCLILTDAFIVVSSLVQVNCYTLFIQDQCTFVLLFLCLVCSSIHPVAENRNFQFLLMCNSAILCLKVFKKQMQAGQILVWHSCFL